MSLQEWIETSIYLIDGVIILYILYFLCVLYCSLIKLLILDKNEIEAVKKKYKYIKEIFKNF